MTPPALTSPRRLLVLLACLGVLALAACERKAPPPAARVQGSLAVAGFTQPGTTAELLAGTLPETPGPAVSQETLRALDADLASMLAAQTVIDANQSRACQELAGAKGAGGRRSAFKYWLDVGGCLKADFLVVPQLIDWRERVGGEWGVEAPASVVLELYLVDVTRQQLIGRYRFNETQAPLSSNILGVGKFFDRGGRFVTARELADEGLRQGLKELGL